MNQFVVFSGDAEAPIMELSRSSRSVADSDVAILRWLGKHAWVVDNRGA